MINDKNNTINNNSQNNNWFKIESRANASGFLEDSEYNKRNTNNGFMKKN